MLRLENWADFKTVIDTFSKPVTYIQFADRYLVLFTYDALEYYVVVIRDGGADVVDFETNYKPSGNTRTEGQSTYLSNVGLVGDRLKVDAQVVSTNNDCPTLPPTFKIEFDESNIDCPASYATLYTYSGSGVFHGAVLDFNSDSVRVKLTLDSNVIFELTLDEIESIQSFSSWGCNDNGGSSNNVKMVTKTSGNRLNIWFDCPIRYSSSVSIEGQRTGSSTKRLDRKLVYLTKDS